MRGGDNELTRHSGLVEAGIMWDVNKSWSMNAKLEALFGWREGAGGMVMATYKF
ncbi:MAG: hypothetical protein GX776_04990 [Oxalobacter sp.]|nr:hypothetical protein [Oxalobacter sp.]